MPRKVAVSIALDIEEFNKISAHQTQCPECQSFNAAVRHLLRLGFAYRKLLDYKEGEK